MANNDIPRSTVIKAIFVGDYAVGKSSLINAYFGIEFNEWIFYNTSTDKFDTKIYVEDKSYKIIIYDSPGSQRYRRLMRFFLRNSRIIFLVFDMTNKQTFLELDNFLELIEEETGNLNKFTYVLIGNKADLKDRWEIKESDAQKFAEILKAKFFLSSAKNAANEFKIFMDEFFKDYIERHKEDLERQANIINQQRAIDLNNNRNRGRNGCH